MTAPPVALNGHAVRELALHVGARGPWVADVVLTEAPSTLPSGAVTLSVGGATLRGTIVAEQSSSFGLSFGARVVGGAGGWSRMLPARGYHNDAGIRAQLIAEDAAREAGEQLGSFEPELEHVGVDFARHAMTASAALELVIGRVSWWVDYAGVTHIGTRSAGALERDAVELLDFDETNNLATFAVDNFAALVPGATLSDARLGGTRVLRDVQLVSHAGSPLRATAHCGQRADAGRLPALVRAIVERLSSSRLHGSYRYRVVTMHADRRVDLQPVRRDAGLPELRYVAQWPGLPGLSATLTLGAEVLISFADGDAAQPVVNAYAGPGGQGWVPAGLVLGGDEGPPAARQGDPVEVLLPPAQFVGTVAVGGVPQAATGVVSWLVPKANGLIVGGSGKVRVAT